MLRGIGRLRAKATGSSGPSTANLLARYQKGVGITSSGGAISAWADQSGNGNHLTQATGSRQPALQGDGTVLFNANFEQFLVATVNLPQPLTYYMRVKPIDFGGGRYFFASDSSSLGFRQGGASPDVYAASNADIGPNSAMTLGSYHNACVVFNGASSVVTVDSTTLTGDIGILGGSQLVVGARTAGTTGWINMQVAELLIYSAAHDASQRASVLSYLSTVA